MQENFTQGRENAIIKIENLKKYFGEIRAVDGVSFEVRKGELFAFLGVNGAGKSTTISVLCGQLVSDGGRVLICDKEVSHSHDTVAKMLGVVYQNSVLDQPLSVYDNLKSRASLYGIKGKAFEERFSELAKLLDFSDLKHRTLGKLSGGQRRKVDIARALIHKPEILILDEPTTGLDPQTRKLLWQVVNNLRKEENLTVFLTTHYMEEAGDADYVVIIDGGKIIDKGTPLELKNKHAGDFLYLYGVEEDKIKSLGVKYEKIRGGFRLCLESTKQATDLIVGNPQLFTDYELTKGKMDDVFLAVTGKNLAEEG